MRNMMVWAAALSALVVLPAHAARLSCASQGSVRAQDSLMAYYSWPVIYRVYRTYERCDENAFFSQAFSTAVIKTLVRKWDSIAELQKFAGSDSTFLDFVLMHIDATAEYENLKQILANTSRNCPKKYERLCARLHARTARATAQIEEMLEEQK
jgi:hypothetical protein